MGSHDARILVASLSLAELVLVACAQGNRVLDLRDPKLDGGAGGTGGSLAATTGGGVS
jgi:hypothetical protein